MSEHGSESKSLDRFVFLAFFLSGVASLACEVVWFKLFGLVLGNGTFTASAVVAIFFVGLGLGSIITGRFSDRWQRPLRAYAMLELALAVVSFATTIALLNWSGWIGWFRAWMTVDAATALPLKLAIATVLLLPPTMLMGSTLPVLARYLVRQRAALSERVGSLYTLNTFGAAVGTVAVGFVLIGAFGVTATAAFGSLLYALIGVGALVASRDEADVSFTEEDPGAQAAGVPGRNAKLLIAVFAMSGFVSVSYEILWFRLLRFFSVNTVYVFAGLLGVYLGGLFVGAAIASRWLSPHRERHLAWFARIQLAIAVAGLVTLAMAGRMQAAMHLLGAGSHSIDALLRFMLIIVVVLGPPATLIGLTFPLASEITVERLSGLGSRLGLVYGLNTIAGALGALVMGFLLLPLIGSQAAALLLAGLNVALFVTVFATHPELRQVPGITREFGFTCLGLVLIAAVLGPRYLEAAQTSFVASQILDFHEGPDGTIVVLEYEEEGLHYQQVLVNGTSYANNRPPGRRYMALLAHLPMLLSENPKETVVICVGTGTTVGSASLHDRTERVWAVDLSGEIFRVAPLFDDWNNGFYKKDHVRQVVADGRHFLTVTDERFDVLTFEPPPPQEAGVANLYSQEFYELAQSRMRKGGLVTQWLPMHQGFSALQKQMVRSMMEVYPHVSLWVADRREGILIGSEAPLDISMRTLRQRMAEPDIAEDLAAVGVNSAEDLLATFVAADDELAGWVGDEPPVTDDRPTVERFLFYDFDQITMEQLLVHRGPVEALIRGGVDQESLDHSRAWTDILWHAVDDFLEGDPAAAAERLAPALELEPRNAYLEYRMGEFQRAAAADSR